MKITLGIVAAIVGFVLWRYYSVRRGATRRDVEIIGRFGALEGKLDQNLVVEASEIQALADPPENRTLLFALLQHHEKRDLFPSQYLSTREQGRAVLAYWLMHPNEMACAPEAIEFVHSTTRKVNGTDSEFLIYKFQMPEGHWGGRDWLIGVAGPFMEGEAAFASGAFSRSGDKFGSTDLEPLVDWYMKLLRLPPSES